MEIKQDLWYLVRETVLFFFSFFFYKMIHIWILEMSKMKQAPHLMLHKHKLDTQFWNKGKSLTGTLYMLLTRASHTADWTCDSVTEPRTCQLIVTSGFGSGTKRQWNTRRTLRLYELGDFYICHVKSGSCRGWAEADYTAVSARWISWSSVYPQRLDSDQNKKKKKCLGRRWLIWELK